MVRLFAFLFAFVTPLIAYAACPETDLGTTLPVSVAGTTVGHINAFAGTCGGGGASAPEQTFIWHAPVADSYYIDTFGSVLDTVLYVRNDNCNGTELACNDDYVSASILQ